MAAARKAKAQTEETIELKRLTEVRLSIPIIGLTPLISHRWSEKAKRMMPGHPDSEIMKVDQGLYKPEEEAEACLYRLPDGRPGHPATGFKSATVGGARFFKKLAMVDCKIMIFVEGEGPEQLVPIEGKLVLREDLPRNSDINKTPNLRYRYMLVDWKARLIIRFVPTSITPSSIVNLVDAGGRGGVGDWRPSAPKSFTGTYGTWRVDDNEEVETLDSGGRK